MELREAFDRVVLRAVSGLLSLLAARVAETDRVGVGAVGGLGADAVLEEGTHAAGELSGDVATHPIQPRNHAQAPHCRSKVSERGHHADAC